MFVRTRSSRSSESVPSSCAQPFYLPRFPFSIYPSIRVSIPFSLPGCLKLEFQVSRSEIRFDDSTCDSAERGFVIDRSSSCVESERNAESCWKWPDKKGDRDGERGRKLGERSTEGFVEGKRKSEIEKITSR